MQKSRARTAALTDEGEKILSAIRRIQIELICAREGFEAATDEALIDSYIYEIIALHKKYEYFLKSAKEMGLTAVYRKIG